MAVASAPVPDAATEMSAPASAAPPTAMSDGRCLLVRRGIEVDDGRVRDDRGAVGAGGLGAPAGRGRVPPGVGPARPSRSLSDRPGRPPWRLVAAAMIFGAVCDCACVPPSLAGPIPPGAARGSIGRERGCFHRAAAIAAGVPLPLVADGAPEMLTTGVSVVAASRARVRARQRALHRNSRRWRSSFRRRS